MKDLLLKQTTTETWQALIQESALKANITLTEELESYLVFLLMRFIKEPNIATSVFATEYLSANDRIGVIKQESLKNIGDKCLLFSGLYPGRASKKHVTVDYFVKLGRTAYLDLSDITDNTLSLLYHELSQEFISLMEVLVASWESDYIKRIMPDDMQQVMQIIRHNKPWRQIH